MLFKNLFIYIGLSSGSVESKLVGINDFNRST